MSAGLMLRGLHEGRNVLLVMRVRLKVRGGQMEMQHGLLSRVWARQESETVTP